MWEGGGADDLQVNSGVNKVRSLKMSGAKAALGIRVPLDLPNSSAGKESICNAGDSGSIPESGRSAGEGIGYPLQYSWASPVAQTAKNPPEMWETWVQSLGWEGLLEKGMATHVSILVWRIPTDREAWQATAHWVTKNSTRLSN